MALPVVVPNTFAGATASIPLSQLDANFSTLSNAVNGIANGVETLANVQITGGTINNVSSTNLSVSNVTVTSGNLDNIGVSNVTITTGTSDGLNVANATLTSVTLVTSALGTPTSGTLTNCTGLPIVGGTTGTLSVARGGTGITSFGSGVATWLGTPSSTNLRSAVTDETGTGSLVFATSPTLVTPVLGTPTSGNLSNCTVDGTNSVGFLNIPQQLKNSAYTLVIGDSGKHIYKSNTSAYTWTIPANSSVAFPIGTAITFINGGASGDITISITSDTMRLAVDGTTGSRTLAGYGVATAIKVASTTWIISGNGLT